MTREEQLDSCKICSNRKFTLNQGLVCKLTGKIADFEIKCQNLVIDETELKNHIPSAYKRYVEKHGQLDREFELVENKYLSRYRSIEDIPFEKTIKDNVLYKVFSLMTLSILIGLSLNQPNSSFSEIPVLICCVLMVANLYWLFFWQI